MTELLTRLFIRDKDNVQDPTVRQQYGTLSGLTGHLPEYPAVPGQAGGRHRFRFHRHHGRCFQ